MSAHVSLKGVNKVFPATRDRGALHALGPIDLDLAKGEFLAVVGPSGCGKSTLLELIAGLAQASDGSIEFEGRRIGAEIPEGVGVVFQEDACFPWLDVAGNVGFGLRKARVSGTERREKVEAALRLVGLTDFASSYPAQLSGGMRQRVCIARTLVTKPRLILLDEPFGALDQQTRLLMGDEVLRIWRETGATVFLITHALDEATMLADRIAVMSARPGRFIDIVETRWPRERDSRVVELPEFGAITARLWKSLREESLKITGRMVAGDCRGRSMSLVAILRVLLIGGVVVALEVLCHFKIIDKLTMQPPHQMAVDLWRILWSGQLNAAIGKTFRNAAIACVAAVIAGVAVAAILSRLKALRQALDPLFATYYAIPIFAFYPLLIIVLGLGDAPQIIIAFMLGVIAVVVNTLNGLDRVPSVLAKTARIHRLGALETVWRITLPGALPYMLTGFKLAVAYSLIGIIGAEFIMSRGGIGYEIAFAYDNFDNATMYPLILLVLGAAITVNGLVSVWERRLLERRGRR